MLKRGIWPLLLVWLLFSLRDFIKKYVSLRTILKFRWYCCSFFDVNSFIFLCEMFVTWTCLLWNVRGLFYFVNLFTFIFITDGLEYMQSIERANSNKSVSVFLFSNSFPLAYVLILWSAIKLLSCDMLLLKYFWSRFGILFVYYVMKKVIHTLSWREETTTRSRFFQNM